jgi:tetratricopeptide (TPR) repeat protein
MAEIDALGALASGARGDPVRSLQGLLKRAGLFDGKPDGHFGPATRDAVASLQKAAGLASSGQLDDQTRKALADKLTGAVSAKVLQPDQIIELNQSIGNMLRGRKQFAEAADYYSKAIALIDKPQKDNWDQFYSRAVCYERTNQWPKAEDDFRKAMDLNPNEPLILNYLGYSWVDRNLHIDEALELIKKAVSLKPDDGYYIDSLGWAYFRMGRYAEAVEQLERAVELKAEDPVINDHLGDAYWRAGRKLEAQFQWSTSLSSKPEAEDIPRIKDKLANGLPAETPSAATADKPADAGKEKPKQP